MHRDAAAYLKLCQASPILPNVFEYLGEAEGLSAHERVEIVLADQHVRWQRQQAIPIEHYLQHLQDVDDLHYVSVLVEEFGYLEERGAAPAPEQFVTRFQQLSRDAMARLCQELEISEPTDAPAVGDAAFSNAGNEQSRTIGRYQVVCPIGQGAFGEVLLAKDPTLDRNVAIKVLNADCLKNDTAPEELLAEARVIAKLDHPNVVPVYDFGTTEDGACFIVSKFIKGRDLRTELAKSMQPAEAVRIVATVARALHAAHRVGVVHRDVKPGNIILDEQRNPHLLDFGLALPYLHDSGDGVYAGTPAYMSPEQARGEPVDGRSDVYSLGILLYEMLAGRRPFSSAASSRRAASQRGEVPPPRQFVDSIPRELERICLQALSSAVTGRFSTAADFAEELETWLTHREVASEGDQASTSAVKPKSLRDMPDQRGRKTWIRLSMGVGVCAILVAGLIWLGLFNSQSALRKWSDEYLPAFARGYLSDGWVLDPNFESGYFYRSQPLLEREQSADPTVVSVAVKTTAPRFIPKQVAWSPQGDRLAVVTGRGQLRIYHWDGKTLDLRFIYRSASANDWVRCFSWHPFDGTAVIATGRGIVIGSASERGDYDISLLIGQVYETNSIGYVVDQGRVLLVFESKTGVRAWDPLTESIYQDFLPQPGMHFYSSGLSNQYAFVSKGDEGVSLEFWEARWNAEMPTAQPDGEQKHGWTFARKQSHALQEFKTVEEVSQIELNGDQRYLMVTGLRQLELFRTGAQLQSLDQIRLQSASDNAPAHSEFLPLAWPSQRSRVETPSVLVRDGARVSNYLVDSVPTAGGSTESQCIPQLHTEMLGARLQDSVFDMHPTREVFAIAYIGGLEIWNMDFETVGQVPGSRCVWDLIPMQLHDKCTLLTRDGSGLVIRTRGEPLGEVIPPVSPAISNFGVIDRNSIVEPELHLLQSTFDAELSISHRNLTDFDIVAVTTPSRRTFSLIPESSFEGELGAQTSANGGSWSFGTTYEPTPTAKLETLQRNFHSTHSDSIERTVIAQRGQVVIICDADGNYTVHRLSDFDAPPISSGKIPNLDQYLSIATDDRGDHLFTGIGGPGETHVQAIDLGTGAPLWKRTLEGYENGVSLAPVSDHVVAASWFGWQVLDARWGKVLDDVSPRPEHGIRHGQLRHHPLEGTLFSWHRYPEVEPAAAWTKDLSLQWFAFAASDGQWLVLSPEGKLLGQAKPNEPFPTRYVGATTQRYEPAVWAPDSQPRSLSPAESLTLVRYHSDGRITCQPFEPLDE